MAPSRCGELNRHLGVRRRAHRSWPNGLLLRRRLNSSCRRSIRPDDFKSLGDGLALRELEAPAGFLLAVFLALDDARVAGQETFFLENGAQIRLVIDKSLGKPGAHGARSAGGA